MLYSRIFLTFISSFRSWNIWISYIHNFKLYIFRKLDNWRLRKRIEVKKKDKLVVNVASIFHWSTSCTKPGCAPVENDLERKAITDRTVFFTPLSVSGSFEI